MRQWGWPLTLAVLSLFGLLAALLGQGGIWWVLSWVALASPLVAIVVHLHRPGKNERAASGRNHEH
jgi:hypothetical protein